MNEQLQDRWTDRDFPLLVAVARHLEEGDPAVQISTVAQEIDLPLSDALRATAGLIGVYLHGEVVNSMEGPMDGIITNLTERGRRATGLWPSGESAAALVDALQQAEATTDDPEERNNLRRAASAVMGVGRDVMTDVMTAVISKQMGGV